VWYRYIFSAKSDILKILDNNQDLYKKVKDAVADIPPNKQSKYEYAVAKFIDQSPQNLKHYINKLYELHNKYNMPLDVSGNRVVLKSFSLDTWMQFEQKIDELLGQKEFQKSQTQKVLEEKNKVLESNEVIKIDNEDKKIDIYPISSPLDGMKFNGILPWQSSQPWCITWLSNNQYYNYRIQQQSTFYIIIDHTRDKKDKWYAVALDHLPTGYAITDLENGSEYDAGDYLKELKSHMKELGDNRDIESLTPHVPLTQEEEHENAELSKNIEDYDKFINLDAVTGVKDAQYKYIIRGHILTDDQFDAILKIPHLLKAYLTTGLPKPDSQISKINANSKISYDREIDKTIAGAKHQNKLNELYNYSEHNVEFIKKVIDAGGNLTLGLNQLKGTDGLFDYAKELYKDNKLSIEECFGYATDIEDFKWVLENGGDAGYGLKFIDNVYTGNIYTSNKRDAKQDAISITKFLVENGANPREACRLWNANLEMVQWLMNHGLDTPTALHYVTKDDVKRWLVENCPNDRNTSTTAIERIRGNVELIKYLVENKNADANKALEYCGCDRSLIQWLIEEKNANPSNVLYCSKNDQNLIIYLVDHGADLTIALNNMLFDTDYEMPIIKLLVEKGLEVHKILIKYNGRKMPLQLIELLLDNGVKADDLIRFVKPPKLNGTYDEIKYLVEKGANPTTMLDLLVHFLGMRYNKSPIHDLITFLINAGADPNKCLEYINKDSELLRLLVQKGAGINNAVNYATEDEDFQMLLDKGADPNGVLGQTRINKNVIFMCLKKNADPTAALTAYVKTSDPNHEEFKTIANLGVEPNKIIELAGGDQELIKWAVTDKGANINTVLRRALYSHPEFFLWAIDHGADINGAMVAVGRHFVDNMEMAKFLISKGADPDTMLKLVPADDSIDFIKNKLSHTLPIIDYLVKNGADPTLALRMYNDNIAYTKELVEKGADAEYALQRHGGDGNSKENAEFVKWCVEKKGVELNKAVPIADKNNPLLKWLLERGADVNLVLDNARWDPQFYRELLNKGANVRAMSVEMFSQGARDPELVKMLVKKGLGLDYAVTNMYYDATLLEWLFDQQPKNYNHQQPHNSVALTTLTYDISNRIIGDDDEYGNSKDICPVFRTCTPEFAFKLWTVQGDQNAFLNASVRCDPDDYSWRFKFIKLLIEEGNRSPESFSYYVDNKALLLYLIEKGASFDQIMQDQYYNAEFVKILLEDNFIDLNLAVEYAEKSRDDEHRIMDLWKYLLDKGADIMTVLECTLYEPEILAHLYQKGIKPDDLAEGVWKLRNSKKHDAIVKLVTAGADPKLFMAYPASLPANTYIWLEHYMEHGHDGIFNNLD